MKKGFTLSEVLITLVIIGVVAAITIPILISNIRDKQNIVHWRKMYSQINQAFMQTLDDGIVPCSGSAYGRTCDDTFIFTRQEVLDREFVIQMTKKLKVAQICETGSFCNTGNSIWVPDWVNKYKTLAGGELNPYCFSQYSVRLVSGELIIFGGHGPWITVDVDGFGNGKDMIGKDVFLIRAYDKFLRPMGSPGTFAGDTCECSKDQGRQGGNYITDDRINNSTVSGACCSAYYLKNDK